MVQDDEYVTISSANLNQRSLDGSRDTELGMGSWQPAYTLANAKNSQDGGGTASHGSAYSGSAAANQNSGDAAATDTGNGSRHADGGGGGGAGSYPGERNDGGGDYTNGGGGGGDYTNGGGSGSAYTNGGGYVGGTGSISSGQGYSNSRDAGQGSQYGSYENGQTVDQQGQNGGRYESGNSHVTGRAPPPGVIAQQPPSQSWGQADAGRQSDSSGLQAGRNGAPQGRQNQEQQSVSSQPQGQGQNQSQGYDQGQGRDQGQGQNSGWAQPQRQPEAEGQKQGSGPGQTHGAGPNQEGDSEPKVAYPKGEVYGYRMALWLEHLGGKYDPVYDQPHSLACVKRVNYLAEQNWLQFSGEEECDMTGHLITFPIIVDRSGAVAARTVNGQFEDIENSIKGKKQPIPAIFLN